MPMEMEQVQVEVIQSSKDKDMLAHEGFLHRRDRTCNSRVFWRCTKERLCKARIVTGLNYADTLLGELRGEHDHLPNPVEIEAKKLAKKIRMQAASSMDAPRAIISK